ncbi:hypothetical protein BJX63DRAFT_162394 [Aspergillus granulosus]|uniref:Uncharacterized protein n=1 Tax=Aspergillus granulosus TaxID=176169 RepID=A0ABR4HJB4_9EURO
MGGETRNWVNALTWTAAFWALGRQASFEECKGVVRCNDQRKVANLWEHGFFRAHGGQKGMEEKKEIKKNRP